MGHSNFLDLFILTSGKLCISIEPFLSDLPSLSGFFTSLSAWSLLFVCTDSFNRNDPRTSLSHNELNSHDHEQRNQWNGGLNLAKVLIRTKSEGVSVELQGFKAAGKIQSTRNNSKSRKFEAKLFFWLVLIKGKDFKRIILLRIALSSC